MYVYLHVPISIQFFRFRESSMIHSKLKYFAKYKEHNRSAVPSILPIACKNHRIFVSFCATLFSRPRNYPTHVRIFLNALEYKT